MISREAMDVLIGTPSSQEAELAGLQSLVDSGMAWSLEGSVGRACMRAIEDGAIVLGVTDHRDYWGNHVPSRVQIVEGTKGSVQYAHDLHVGELGHDDGDSESCAKCVSLRTESSEA